MRSDRRMAEQLLEPRRRELGSFDRPGRDVQAEPLIRLKVACARQERLDTEAIKLDGAAARLRRSEETEWGLEARFGQRSDEALEADDIPADELDNRLIDGPDRPPLDQRRHRRRGPSQHRAVHGAGGVLGVIDLDERAALLLGLRECLVRLIDELDPRGPELGRPRDPGRERELLAECAGRPGRERRREQTAGRLEAVLHARVRQEDREFIAAEPVQPIRLSEHSPQERADLTEHEVARRVTGRLVHGLEIVEVDEHESERVAVAPGEVELALEFLLECTVIAEPGQRVDEGPRLGGHVQVAKAAPRRIELLRRRDDAVRHDKHQREGRLEEHDGPGEGRQGRPADEAAEVAAEVRGNHCGDRGACDGCHECCSDDDQRKAQPHELHLSARVGRHGGLLDGAGQMAL